MEKYWDKGTCNYAISGRFSALSKECVFLYVTRG